MPLMANKHIANSILGVELHPLTQSPAGRTHKLLKTLASRGVKGVDDDRLSMIDRSSAAGLNEAGKALLPDTLFLQAAEEELDVEFAGPLSPAAGEVNP